MAGITTFLDPSLLPARTMDQQTFDNMMAYVMQTLPKWGAEVNSVLGMFNAALAGGAYALPYTIDLSSTTNADPGAGKLRFNAAAQSSATALYLDLLANSGADVSGILDTFDASTSTVKGKLRLVKMGDLSKYITFEVTARTTNSGYRTLTVGNALGSSTNPFANGDAVVMFFDRTGDKGQQGIQGLPGGYVALASTTITAGLAAIDFLNVFDPATYDRYEIVVDGLSMQSQAGLALQFATGGIVDSSTNYSVPGATSGTSFSLTSGAAANSNMSSKIEVSGAALARRTVRWRSNFYNASSALTNIGLDGTQGSGGPLSGFRLLCGGITNAGGTVRVYGIKN